MNPSIERLKQVGFSDAEARAVRIRAIADRANFEHGSSYIAQQLYRGFLDKEEIRSLWSAWPQLFERLAGMLELDKEGLFRLAGRERVPAEALRAAIRAIAGLDDKEDAHAGQGA